MSGERWISARYAGKCGECECGFSEGDRILWCPNEGRRADVYCSICGEDVVSESEEDREIEVEL